MWYIPCFIPPLSAHYACGLLTDCEAEAEGDVADAVDAAVDGGVPDVDQVAQLRHHARVHHADGEPEAGVRHDQVVDAHRQRDLRQRQQREVV